MDEQRIGMMYMNLFKDRAQAAWDWFFRGFLRRSGVLPVLVIVLLIAIPSFLWRLHMRGQFHTFKQEMRGEQNVRGPALPRPGGVDPLMLTRAQTPGSNQPQFLSATILPGVGMSILQITAFLPNRGEVPLLLAPSLTSMADSTVGPRVGLNDTRGAIELPWAGGLAGIVSPLGTDLTTTWKGRTIEVPTDVLGRRGLAEGGLLWIESVDDAQMVPSGDGSSANGIFRATDFAGHWPSKTDITVNAQISSRAIDLTVTARNVGEQAEPMGIGWHPRFSIPSGHRDGIELRMPNGERLATPPISDRGEAPKPDTTRFTGHSGELGIESIDESLGHLKPGLLDSAPMAELRDRTCNFGLRMTAASPSIRVMRVLSPAGANYISIGTQTNYDDPLGRQWSNVEGAGIVTLQPGQTLEWKVRLEIFSVLNR